MAVAKNKSQPEAIIWDHLSPRERRNYMRIAYKIARRESRILRERFGINALGIAPAFRTIGKRRRVKGVGSGPRPRRRDTPNTPQREFVLCVTVSEKWPRGQEPKDLRQRVPPYFLARERRERGYRSYRIPTDVEESFLIDLHARRSISATLGDEGEQGCECCLVRDADSNALFLLSCNHVLGLMASTDRCAGTTLARIDQHSPDCVAVASVIARSDIAPMRPESRSPPSLDAAIARVNDPAVVSSTINQRRARGVLFDTTRLMVGQAVVIPGLEQEVIGTIKQIDANGRWLPLPCGNHTHNYFFPGVIEYTTNPRVARGDSGAAVLTRDGLLAGMHFAGARGSPDGRGYAMLAADIFADRVFGRRIKLEPGHRP